MLTEDRRKQLDEIVQKMVVNKESDSNVRFVVEDFKSKYGNEQAPIEQKKQMPILTKESGGFGTALKDVAVGGVKGAAEGLQGLGKLALEAGSLGKIDTTKLGVSDETLKAKSRGEQVGKVIEGVGEFAGGFVAAKGPQAVVKAKQAYTASKEAKATERVTEMIMPKPTVKQAKLAQSEGRLVKGKEPTLLRSGTADTVLPTQKTLSARDTIIKKIPNASVMNEAQLFDAVDSEITKSAQALKPQMKATPIKPETVQKINDDWTALKKSQIDSADTTQERELVQSWQNRFEERLMKSGDQSYDDLWETRKAYDESIPDNVKRANDFSDITLQNKKDIWLQNRDVLNKAMDDVAGESFKEMSSLYEARTGLLSKAKIDKAQMSKLNQFWKDHPGVVSTLKYGGAYGVLKSFGVPLP